MSQILLNPCRPVVHRAGFFLLLWLWLAASVAQAEPERWLFIFDTSSAMKKRLPAVENEIKILFTTSIGGNFHQGDSIGVWTYNRKLRMGEFPLTTWMPDQASATADQLGAFLRKQSYASGTTFTNVRPMLERVVKDSERLTVILFTDGESDVIGTPYDSGINETLRQTAAERKAVRQPAVVVLRSQLGKYVGATVNFPPSMVTIPPFPRLPREIKLTVTNPPVVTAPVARPATSAVPALIIVGTRVSTNVQEAAQLLAAAATNPPAVAEVFVTNAPAPVATPITPAVLPKVTSPTVAIVKPIQTPATAPVVPTVKSPAVIATNPPVAAVVEPPAPAPVDGMSRVLIFAAAGLFGVAVALGLFLLLRHRREPGVSLITSSMNDPKTPSKK